MRDDNHRATHANLTAIAGELVKKRLRHGQSVCFIIASSSMRPWLQPGSRVRVRAADPAVLRMGDVVVVQTADGQWRAHRLIRRLPRRGATGWVTKGDGAPYADEPLAPACIAGLVTAAMRVGTGWMDWRTTAMRRAGMATAIMSRGAGAAVRSGSPLIRRLATGCARIGIRLVYLLTCVAG